MLSRAGAVAGAAVLDLVAAAVALALVASDAPRDGTCPDGAPTPLHSAWIAVAAFLGAFVVGLLAAGMRLGLPPEETALRSLAARVQAICMAAAVLAGIAGYVVVASYACWE